MARGAQEQSGVGGAGASPRPDVAASPPAHVGATARVPQRKIAGGPLAFDPTDHAFVVDPYPRYRELQESPVLH
ncbi:MAG: hypothetical protein M0Z93_00575, partial [Actinomycetota bacterium]|nr:hypothetical protein [Actinomycetota bacterium]